MVAMSHSQSALALRRRTTLGDLAASTVVAGVQQLAQWLPERRLLAAARALGFLLYHGASLVARVRETHAHTRFGARRSNANLSRSLAQSHVHAHDPVLRFRRTVVDARIAAVFADSRASPEQQRRIARDAYVHLSLSLLWFLRLPAIDHARVTQELVSFDGSGVDAFRERVIDARSNAILLAGHVGACALTIMTCACFISAVSRVTLNGWMTGAQVCGSCFLRR